MPHRYMLGFNEAIYVGLYTYVNNMWVEQTRWMIPGTYEED